MPNDMQADEDRGLRDFRAEVRDFIEKAFPPSLRRMPNPMSREALAFPNAEQEAWRKAVAAKGWGTPTWPREYGAAGLTRAHERIWREELADAGAYNPIGGMGVMMLGPTLLEFGTEAQKRQHLPPIVRGDFQWCQGFSEPGAGSDLASLQMKAEDRGDHFLINGQKIWTSGAQWARWCFCLVRTDNSRKHDGISFLLVDMATQGIEVRPIKLISGNSTFCEVSFTDVKAPKDQLVGRLDGGWSIAKRLLQYERSGLSNMANDKPARSLLDLARTYVGVDAQARIADADLRQRIVVHDMEARVFQLTAQRAAAEAKGAGGPSAASSIMKNAGTRLFQERAELTIEILGQQGLGWEGDGFEEEELVAVRDWLTGKATTIYGGSQEIQNNIIAKRILGLPDSTRDTKV
jgi:alkylation response protein AidB-like acyl-CoA dehydrogenase